jgi:hypothetical protein
MKYLPRRLAIPTGRSHIRPMRLILKLAPAITVLALAAAMICLSQRAPLYA